MIGEYTLPQLEVFMGAIEDAERERDRMALILARSAKADAKQFQKILKGLSDGR